MVTIWQKLCVGNAPLKTTSSSGLLDVAWGSVSVL